MLARNSSVTVVIILLLEVMQPSFGEDHDSKIEKAKPSDVHKAKTSSDAYWLHAKQAGDYEKQGSLDKAIASWTEAIRLGPQEYSYPDTATAFFTRAWLYEKNGNAEKALADYSAAIGQNDWNVLPYCCRAELHRKRQEFNEAIADYSIAIERRSDNAFFYLGRASSYLQKHDLEQAIIDCNEAIRLKPDFSAAFGYLGVAYMKKGEIDKAILAISEAISLEPKKSGFYELRNLAYSKKGDSRRATEDHNSALQFLGNSGTLSWEVSPFEIVRNSDGFFVFADHRCSKYVPASGCRDVSARFSDAQLKEMSETSLDATLFLRYVEARWPLSRLKTYCTADRRLPEIWQNLVGDHCFPEALAVHKGHHDGFDKIYVYACHDEGMDGKCSYVGSLMTNWRRWTYSLNVVRGGDHWAIIENLPNDFMDNPGKYLREGAPLKK
mgnify:CR=1 FL=1